MLSICLIFRQNQFRYASKKHYFEPTKCFIKLIVHVPVPNRDFDSFLCKLSNGSYVPTVDPTLFADQRNFRAKCLQNDEEN